MKLNLCDRCRSLIILFNKRKLRPNLRCAFLIGFSIILLFTLFTASTILAQNTKTFIVNTTGDESDPNAGEIGDDGVCDVDPNTPDNQCSFRAAIENQNGNRQLGQNRIRFEIPNAPGTGSIIIQVGISGLGPLPPVLGSVSISGMNDNFRRIELDGTLAGANAIGLRLLGGECEIFFFVINNFSSHGIFIAGTPPPGEGKHRIESNYIGTDSTGKIAKGNGGDGIFIDNTPGNIIGGSTVRRNIISGNEGYGISINGLDPSQFGTNGAQNNQIIGNLIGLDISEDNALPNKKDAVILTNAPNNTIGSANESQVNKMAGNNNGITVTGSLTDGIKILGNFIGDNKTGAKFKIGVSASAKPIVIEGNFFTEIEGVGVDLFVNGDGSYNIRKNSFAGNMKIGGKLRFSEGRTVQIIYQNNFHTDNNMSLDVEETVSGKIDWLVAGDTMKLGQVGANFIFRASGNKDFNTGIYQGNAGVAFNYVVDAGGGSQIALSVNGDTYIGNGGDGRNGKVTLKGGAEFRYDIYNSISRNNGKDGDILQLIADANAIATLSALDNSFSVNGGVGLRWINNGINFLTVRAFIERNIFERNTIIGVDLTGILSGKSILDNTIINNTGPGILIDGSTVAHIQGNTISGNGIGILVNDEATASINNNIISANGKGVAFGGTGTGSALTANSIFNNNGLGIDLANDGLTANDVGDADIGPNNLQNFPILTAATNAGGNASIQGTLNSTANTTFKLEFYSNNTCNPSGRGEGQLFLDSAMVTTDASGNVSFTANLPGITLAPGAIISATATDPNQNSSEFSACLQTGTVPITADLELTKQSDKTQYTAGEEVIFTINLINKGPDNASGIVITDLLPAGISFVQAVPSSGAYDNATGVWTVGTLNSNQQATLAITGSITQTGTITNTAEVIASNEPDPDSSPGNNISTEDDQSSIAIQVVQQSADLELTKQANKTQYTIGEQVIFTISLINKGPDNATGIVVKDILPVGISFVQANPSVGNYNNATGNWSVGTLNSNQQATLAITGSITQTGTITNTAEVMVSNEPDPDSSPGNHVGNEDDQSSASIQVIQQTDLSQQYNLLIQQIESLMRNGKLSTKDGQHLIHMVEQSAKQATKGNIQAAISLMNAFITQTKNTHKTKLANSDRQALILAAQNIIDQLKAMQSLITGKKNGNSKKNDRIMPESNSSTKLQRVNTMGNYPNPFRSFTNISFKLAEQSKVQMTIYDENGKMIRRLLDKTMQSGTHTVTWQTASLPAGVYIVHLKADNFVKTIQMMHVK